MQRSVDPASLVDPRVIFRSCVVPARGQFAQRNLIRRIAVNLVRADEGENRLRGMLPRSLQQIHCPQSIHFEIHNRYLPRLVMRRLRRAMRDQIKPLPPKKSLQPRTVPNVNIRVSKTLGRGLQPPKIPQRVSRRPKKHPPHIIVDAKNTATLPVKMLDRLRANQPAGPGHQYILRHEKSLARKTADPRQYSCSLFIDYIKMSVAYSPKTISSRLRSNSSTGAHACSRSAAYLPPPARIARSHPAKPPPNPAPRE